MIYKVIVTNDRNESITLDLFDPFSSGFVVRSIDGLGPVDADLNFAESAPVDGGSFNGARQGTRNIVFDLVFLDTNVSIERVRHLSYKYWPVKRKVKIRVETDERTLETDGYVEKNEPAIWADDFEGCQISVLCESPYFTNPKEMTNKLSDVVDSFHFPFASEEDPGELTFGYLNVNRDVIVKNQGDVSTGVIFELRAYGSVTNPVIYNYLTREWFGLTFTMIEGDIIRINTQRGNKTVTLTREGVTYNIINYMTSSVEGSASSLTWLQLDVGDQAFVLYFEEWETDPSLLDLIIKHKDQYLGV